MNRAAFFNSIRNALFGGFLSVKQVEGMNAILDYWEAHFSHEDNRWLAYMLATTFHETAQRMQPIEEYGKGRGLKYSKRIKMDGTAYTDTKAIFYGRGFVQLTWYENYAKAGKKLGEDFIKNPSLALDLGNATKILFWGMIEGWFTGRKLSDYFNAKDVDPFNARRIINGIDRAADIVGYYKKFFDCINSSLTTKS